MGRVIILVSIDMPIYIITFLFINYIYIGNVYGLKILSLKFILSANKSYK